MALDTEDTKASLFGNFKRSASATSKSVIPIEEENPSKVKKAQTNPQIEKINRVETEVDSDEALLPKWQQLDRVTVLLTSEQKEGIDRLAKRLMKHRARETKGKREKERITGNTVVRGLIDLLNERADKLELNVIETEEDLKAWISQLFK